MYMIMENCAEEEEKQVLNQDDNNDSSSDQILSVYNSHADVNN